MLLRHYIVHDIFLNKRTSKQSNGDTLVLAIISQTGEKIIHFSKKTIEIHKKEGIVIVATNVPIIIKEMEEERILNQVLGMEALPILLVFPKGITKVSCTISVD